MRGLRTLTLPVLVVGLLIVSSAGNAGEPVTSETFSPSFKDRKWKCYRCFKFDLGGGLRFKVKSQKVGGEKRGGISLMSGQNGGFGFFNTGLRLGQEWKLNATFTFNKSKGLECGSTYAGVEVDYPYVPVGTMPTRFLFTGFTWHQDGMSAFANDSGSTVGSQPFYPGARSIDLEWEYISGLAYTIKSRATGTSEWDTIYAGDPSAVLSGPFGLGFGLNHANKCGTVFINGISLQGNLFDAERMYYLEDFDRAIDLEMQALEAPDLTDKYNLLAEASWLLDEMAYDMEDDLYDGYVDLDGRRFFKLVDGAIRLDGKAAKNLDPDPEKNPVQSWSSKQRKKVEKAIDKKRQAAEMIKLAWFDHP